MVEVVSGALRALVMLGEGTFYVWTAGPDHRQELLGRFIRENIFSLKSFKYADSRFGHVVKWFMWLMLVDTDLLMQIQYGINLWSDKELLAWRKNTLESFGTVGIAGSILATVDIGAFALDSISDINWTARAFFAVSLITGVLSVIFGTRLQRRLYQLGEPLRFRQWLSDGEVYDRRERQHDAESDSNGAEIATYPLQSSIHAVRVLQLPVELLTISAVTFVVGLILYTALMWKQHSDPGGLDYRNIMICLLLVLAALVGYYELNMGMKSIEDTTMHLLFEKKKKKKEEKDKPWQDPVIVKLRRQRKAWPSPGDSDDAVRDEEDGLQGRLRDLRQLRRPWIYRYGEDEDDLWIQELKRFSEVQQILVTQMSHVTDKIENIFQRLPSQEYTKTEPYTASQKLETVQPGRSSTTKKGHEEEGTPGPSRHPRDEHKEESNPISNLVRLAKAKDEKSVLFMIDDESTGMGVNTIGEGGRTALMEAASVGDMGFVNALLHRDADPLIKDENGKTAEDLARENKHFYVADELARKASRSSTG